MKNLKKKLEEEIEIPFFSATGSADTCAIFVKNKDLLEAVLPLLREIYNARYANEEILEYLDHIEELLK